MVMLRIYISCCFCSHFRKKRAKNKNMLRTIKASKYERDKSMQNLSVFYKYKKVYAAMVFLYQYLACRSIAIATNFEDFHRF